MSSSFAQTLEPWISRARLEAYRPEGGDDFSMIVTYLHNVRLCESLYTCLGFLEVALRNSIHVNLSQHFGSQAWFNLPSILEYYQAKEVKKISDRIRQEGKPVTADRVVSELSFGFWVSLLSKPYDTTLWRANKAALLKGAFPNVPTRKRQRNQIYKRYNTIRLLRNRVFHHETLWNRTTLLRDYDFIYEAIGWICPEMVAAAKLIDRFSEVMTNDKVVIETTLRQHLATKFVG